MQWTPLTGYGYWLSLQIRIPRLSSNLMLQAFFRPIVTCVSLNSSSFPPMTTSSPQNGDSNFGYRKNSKYFFKINAYGNILAWNSLRRGVFLRVSVFHLLNFWKTLLNYFFPAKKLGQLKFRNQWILLEILLHRNR